MSASKTFFEQIPIETVKRIAIEFPGENIIGESSGNAELPGEVRSPRESWREVAQKVQDEPDPNRLADLVEQLIAQFDEEQLGKRLSRKRDGGNRSD